MRKSFAIVTLSLLAVALLASLAFGEKSALNYMDREANRLKNVKSAFAGAERPIDYYTPNGSQSLGADQVVSNSPGIEVGMTTYDLQSNTRMQRQVEYNGRGEGSYWLHFDWMIQEDSVPGGNRGTGYEAWDTDAGAFVFNNDPEILCDVHPRLGSGANYSGYVGLDVDTENKVVIHNHHEEGAGYASTIWYDFTPASCFFSPYKRRIPDTVMQYCIPPDQIISEEYEMIWPQAEYQVFDGDTVTHVFSMQFETEIDPSIVAYFRRVGSDTVGSWDYPPMCVDTIPTISQCVTASHTSGRVALVWQAPPGAYPGDPESWERDWVENPGLGVNQRTNDIYYMTSENMGASWTAKVNMTAYDSTVGGYLGHGDMSILLDPNTHELHVLWPARIIVGEDDPNYEGGLGEYTNFWGSRMLHWREAYGPGNVRPVKDANWNIADTTDNIDSLACTGGAWNEMSLVKPMLSYCDGKYYAFFVQFLDLYNGIYDDCAESRWDGTGTWSGTANGEIYVSVSDNDGDNWDVARNLTQTYTPKCEKDGAGGLTVCESDHYVTTSKYGMYIDPADSPDFFDADVVVPEGGTDDGDYYIDVQYVNDKHPGSVMQNDGVWSYNPVKWFRVPCVEPIPNPVLVYSPLRYPRYQQIEWTKPNELLSLPIDMENVGNAPLTINSVTMTANTPSGSATISGYTGGTIPADGTIQTFNIDVNYGSPAVVTGEVEINSNTLGNDPTYNYVTYEVIVADTVQFPVWTDIRTDSQSPKAGAGFIRMTFNNAGNIGHSGVGDYNLDYFDDCDTTGNQAGDDDRANVYLYDASPFICRIVGGDTIMYHYMFGDAKWLEEDGFKPLEGPTTDTTTYDDYQYGYTGQFVTPDSQIAVEVEYFAPIGVNDTSDFIVMKQRVTNFSDGDILNLYIGDAMDWDIPTDSGSNNQSDHDESMMFMWQTGYEYAPDSITNDDCVFPADLRHGGFAYYGGFRLPAGQASQDSIGEPQAMWTENNADWVYPEGDFVGSQIWEKCANTTGYETWEATGDFSNPDSQATDLHMVCVFGNFDLPFGDTLVFVKILASEYNTGEIGIKATIEKAKAWIGGHPEIFTWPEFQIITTCCNDPGDANNSEDGTAGEQPPNILDITYLIGYLYQGGPEPVCCVEGDPNGTCTINILDITYLIAYLYQDGPPPECVDCSGVDPGGEDWCHLK